MKNDAQATRILNQDELPYSVMLPGTVLRQRYRLDSEIGRGGMGIVYRATDLELMREVAVKVLAEAASADARQRLIREARAAAALNHPHIISVHDVGEAEGIPFFVMELVEGPSLAKARPSDLPRIVEIACQVCAALDHAHANRIVHRDLKPDNVLLSATRSGSVKLADLVKAIAEHGDRIVLCGDFNVEPDSETFDILRRAGLVDLVMAGGHTGTRTSHYKKPGRFADYMLINDAVAVKRFEIVANPEVSDHCPLFLEI